jgi:hypothetical protein
MTARAVRHRCFGPHVIEIAHFLADTDEVPADEVVRFFEVAEALLLKVEGSA